jgi:hypothetical protein
VNFPCSKDSGALQCICISFHCSLLYLQGNVPVCEPKSDLKRCPFCGTHLVMIEHKIQLPIRRVRVKIITQVSNVRFKFAPSRAIMTAARVAVQLHCPCAFKQSAWARRSERLVKCRARAHANTYTHVYMLNTYIGTSAYAK